MTAGAYLAVPLGMVLAGYLLDWIGIRATLLAQAACYFVITFSLLFNPALREMNRTKAVADMTNGSSREAGEIE